MSPNQQSVLITGCTNGSAGHALALEFAAKEMRVFATARSLKSLSGLEEKGIETLTLDVTSSESIAALKAEIITRTGGKLDMLFNNAGMMYEAPAIEADPDQVRTMFNTNVFGVFDMVSAFTPLLLASAASSSASQPPVIINTASIVTKIPLPFAAAYNASKAAVVSYSDALRLELAPLGIKVVTLYMGVVSTNLSSPDAINFGPDSLYANVEAKVQERGREHRTKGTKAEQFAKEVVQELMKNRGMGKGERVWKGLNATVVWLLSLIGARGILERVSQQQIGFDDKVKAVIGEKGRNAAQKGLI